jgi:hypothetical protein
VYKVIKTYTLVGFEPVIFVSRSRCDADAKQRHLGFYKSPFWIKRYSVIFLSLNYGQLFSYRKTAVPEQRALLGSSVSMETL